MSAGTAQHVKSRRLRWPWSILGGFKVSSLANGNILIEPDYHSKWTPEAGGGPGLFSRLRLALWIEGRLKKRGAK